MNQRQPVRRLIAGIVVVSILALTACRTGVLDPTVNRTTGGPTTPISYPSPVRSATDEPPVADPQPLGDVAWTYHEQRPATRFEKVDGVLVGYTLKRKRLRLTALDPSNGSVLWDRAASPGYVPPGVPPSVTRIGRNVVLLRPTGSARGGHFWTTVAVLRGSTGRIVAESRDSYLVDGLPERCGRKICFDGKSGESSDDHHQYALDPDSGKVTIKGEAKPLAEGAWRSIGEAGLVDVDTNDDGDGDVIGRVVNGELVWQRRYDSVFGLEHNPNAGWSFHYDSADELFIGEVGWYPGTDKPIREDLRRHAVLVGLNAKTGYLEWREKETSNSCAPVSEVLSELTDSEDYRCRYRSGYLDPEKGARYVWEDVGITLERFDPRTGKTLWEVDTDSFSAQEWDGRSSQVMVWDDRRLLATRDGRPITIDIETGETARVRGEEIGWCVAYEDLPYAVSYYQRKGDDSRISGPLTKACGRARSDTGKTRVPPRAISAAFGGLRVTTGTSQVVAVRVR